MSILSNLRTYAGSWSEIEREKLSKDELKAIKKIEVVSRENEWGTSTSMCFHMLSGGQKFIPLHRDSTLENGDVVDPKTVEIITLEREGDEPCYKCDGETK